MEALFQTQALAGQISLHEIEVLLGRFFQPGLETPLWVNARHGVDEPCDNPGHDVRREGAGSFTLRGHGLHKSS